MKVNLLAPTLCSKLAISNMTAQNKAARGHIINILSVWGCEVPRREYTHFYSATKHALKAVAEGLRIELATRKLSIKVVDIKVDVLNTFHTFTAHMLFFCWTRNSLHGTKRTILTLGISGMSQSFPITIFLRAGFAGFTTALAARIPGTRTFPSFRRFSVIT